MRICNYFLISKMKTLFNLILYILKILFFVKVINNLDTNSYLVLFLVIEHLFYTFLCIIPSKIYCSTCVLFLYLNYMTLYNFLFFYYSFPLYYYIFLYIVTINLSINPLIKMNKNKIINYFETKKFLIKKQKIIYNTECPICLLDLKESSYSLKDCKCKYSYHKECLLIWFEYKIKCPFCMKSIEV